MCPVIRDIKQQAARVIIIITSNRGMLGMTEVIGTGERVDSSGILNSERITLRK